MLKSKLLKEEKGVIIDVNQNNLCLFFNLGMHYTLTWVQVFFVHQYLSVDSGGYCELKNSQKTEFRRTTWSSSSPS